MTATFSDQFDLTLEELFTDFSSGPVSEAWAGETDSNDSFTADCQFLLDTVFNVDSACHLPSEGVANPTTSSLPSSIKTPYGTPYSSAYTCDASGTSSCWPPIRVSLFHQPYSSGTPVMSTPATRVKPEVKQHAALPPKPRSHRDSAGPLLASGVKKVVKPPVSRVAVPFKIGGMRSGMSLQDMNNNILEMAKRAGM